MAKKVKLKPLYPDGLLTKSREERFQFYKHEQFMHREFESVHAQVISAIRNSGHKRVIALLGPSGVGKSEVKRYLQETVAEMMRGENSKDGGRLPYISYYVPAYRGKFDWKDESETFLLAGHEPAAFLDHKIGGADFDFPGNIIRRNSDGEPLVIRDLALRKLMRARQSCLKHRRPKVVFADEAHHYKKVGVGRKQLLDQVDIIKLILDLSEIVHVFIGTYELFDLIDVSEQIAGRTRYIHFPRYRLSNEKDIISFKAALRGAQQKLPLPGVLDEADWAKEYKYFYYGCVGCIGTLKEWILRALDLALEAEENSRLSGEADPKSDCPSHPFRYYLDETRDTPGQLG